MSESTSVTYRLDAGSILWPGWLYSAVRYALAAVFIYAGVTKMAAPEAFATEIAGYGLLPKALVPFAALGLPGLEVLAGIGLALDIRGSLAAVAGMTALFLAVLAYGIALGLDVDCGCYGPGDPEGEAFHDLRPAFFRDLLMVAGIIYAYAWRRKKSPGLRRPLKRLLSKFPRNT